MRTLIRILALTLGLVSTAFAQMPASFSWGKYVASSRNQLRQGPCFTFAAVNSTETMYRLMGGNADEFSKRQVYSRGNPSGPVSDLQTAMNYLQNTGVVPATAYPYPVVSCNENRHESIPYPDDPPAPLVYVQNLNDTALQIAAGRRIKITFDDVAATLRSNNDAIKSLLINKGPIALNFTAPGLHYQSSHAYELIGWKTVNGQLLWIFNDSWPCAAGFISYAADLVAAFNQNLNNRAYIITSVTEQTYSSQSGWSNSPIPVRAFELEAENQIAKIANPAGACFNRGTYTVSGLNLLPGSTVVEWAVRSDWVYPGDVTINSSGTVSGNGSNVTVVATILRPNGLLETITKNVGTVGMPVRIDTVSSACYGGRRELRLQAYTPGAASVAINIPPSPDGKYYTIGNGTSGVYINYNGTGAITYNVTVQSTAGSCSLNYTSMRFVVIMPCY